MACSSLRSSLNLHAKSIRGCVRASSMELEDHDLIGQERMAIGQVEHGLLRQLLRVVRARASLEDDFLIRVNDMKVTNPAASDTVDVSLDKLGEFQMVLAEPEPPKLCC
jgi:hypothetical protein